MGTGFQFCKMKTVPETEGSDGCIATRVLKGSRLGHPKIVHCDIILSWRYWKNSKCRESHSPNPFICPETDPPEGAEWSQIPPGLHSPGKTACCHRRETRTDTKLCHRLSQIPSTLFPQLSFLKIIHSLLRGLYPSPRFPVVFKPKI